MCALHNTALFSWVRDEDGVPDDGAEEEPEEEEQAEPPDDALPAAHAQVAQHHDAQEQAHDRARDVRGVAHLRVNAGVPTKSK